MTPTTHATPNAMRKTFKSALHKKIKSEDSFDDSIEDHIPQADWSRIFKGAPPEALKKMLPHDMMIDTIYCWNDADESSHFVDSASCVQTAPIEIMDSFIEDNLLESEQWLIDYTPVVKIST